MLFNSLVGEYSWRLNLTAEAPRALTLDPMTVALGSTGVTAITVTNPTDATATFTMESDCEAFTTHPEAATLPAGGSVDVQVLAAA